MAAELGLIITALAGLLILWAEKIAVTPRQILLSAVLLAAAMVLRGAAMDYETLDYQNFLSRWVEFFRSNGGWSALDQNIGNYNLPYLYFLAAFSYSDVSPLHLIKLLSIFFDLMLAWSVMRLVYIFTSRRNTVIAAFFVTLFLPTVILNGAVWGQCDSIYSAFAVWSIYFALDRKPVLSVAMVALSFAFKLQAVFIMPVFLIFVLCRRMKWYHLLVFPAVYVLTVLPAVLEGRPFMDTLLLYFNQAGTVGDALNYNSSSVFAFVRNTANAEVLGYIGIAAAFGFLALLYLYCIVCKGDLDDRSLLICTALIVVAVPFLLPHMHDRYFFIADIMSVALAFALPWLAPAAALVSFGSLLGYHAYLKMRFLLPMSYGAAALLLVIVAYLVALMIKTPKKAKKRA